MAREFRIVPVTRWQIVEATWDERPASIETICEVQSSELAHRLARNLAEKYGGDVTSPQSSEDSP